MADYGSPGSPRTPQTYQIDFSAVASGKRIASSKRRVRWRFGFANSEALASGETGTACRGEEHDVTLVWSIASGKRLILVDGHEVHYSSSRNAIFDFSWTMRGNHVLKMVAHVSPPLSPTPGFRQYDFFIDGQSFFTFPKVFRLGLAPGQAPASPSGASTSYAGMAPTSARRSASGEIVSMEAPHNPDEEEAYLQEAIRQSLRDDTPASTSRGAPTNPTSDLLDFSSPPAGAPTQTYSPSTNDLFPPQASASNGPYPYQQESNNMFASQGSITSDPWGAPAPAATTDPWGASAPATHYGYGTPAAGPLPALTGPAPAATGYGGYNTDPVQAPYGAPALYPPPVQSYAPAPAQYGGPEQTHAPDPVQAPYQAPVQSPYQAPPPASAWQVPAAIATQPPYGQDPSIPPSVTPQAQATPSTIGFSSPPPDFSGFSSAPQASEPAQAPSSDPVVFSMNALSGEQNGLVDSNSTAQSASLVDQAYSKLVNMDTFSLVSKNDEARSNPFDMGSTTVGGNVPLAQMSKHKSQTAPKKEVMRSPAPPPGSMIVASNHNGNWGGQYGQPQQPDMQQAYGQQQSPMQQQPQYGQQQPPMQPQPQYGQQQPPMQQPGQLGQHGQQHFGQTNQMQYGQAQQPPAQPGYNYF
jgi:hypothetical protein